MLFRQEWELIGCMELWQIEELRRGADEVAESSSGIEEHVRPDMLVTKLELENSRLSAQLHWYVPI